MHGARRNDPLARVLVVGAGSAGRRHLRNVRSRHPGALLACWRLSGRPADPELQQLAAVVVATQDEAVAFRPDAVIVAGPASSHVASAMPFARAGIPLLLEKPVATTLEEADALLATVERSGGLLLVGYTLRFHPLGMALLDSPQRQAIGPVLGVRASVGQYLPDWRPGTDWRAGVSARPELGGGALLELSHEFDLVRAVAGDAIGVTAVIGHLGGLGLAVEDYAEVLVEFASGAIGNVHVDFVQRHMTRHTHVIGRDGSAELDWVAGTLVWQVVGQPDEISRLAAGFERNDTFLAELDHFTACIAGDESPRVTGADGRATLAMALAAKVSAVERRHCAV